MTVNEKTAEVAPPSPSEEELFARNVKDVLFDYDKAEIRGDQATTAQSDAGTPQFHNTQIDSGVTLSVTGGNTSVHVGSLTNAATTYSNYTTIAGPGTFNINNTGATVQIRQGSSGASFTGRATLDMSGLANFTATVSNFRVGFGEGSEEKMKEAIEDALKQEA